MDELSGMALGGAARRRRAWRLVAAGLATMAAATILVGGCSSRGQRQTEFMRRVGGITVSTEALRVRTLAFAHRMMTTLEATADEIREATDDPEIEARALWLKIQAVPAVQEAAFNSEPLAAMIDLWALCEQLHNAFTTGRPRAFGDQTPKAVEATTYLLDEIKALARSIRPEREYDKAAEDISAWAEKHPIEGPYFVRRSIIQDLEKLSDSYRRVGGLGAVSTLDERVRVMLDRLPFYTEYVPKQVVWQAELALLLNAELIREETGLGDLARLEAIADELGRVGDVTADLDELIASEREELLRRVTEEVGAQRRAIIDEASDLVDEQREIVLAEVRALIASEREAAVSDVASIVASERRLLLEDVERQRRETIEVLRQERGAIVDEARAIARETVDASLLEARALVDHAIWRLTQLMAVAGVVVLVVIVVLRRLWSEGKPVAPG